MPKIILKLLHEPLLLITLSLIAQIENGWTIMHYVVGSNSSEVDLLDDIGEMIR